MKIKKIVLSITLLSLVLVSFGCGGGPKMNEVSGKITINGQVPTNMLEILFIPVEANKLGTANGGTDANGSYKLFYPGGKQGAPAGEYDVEITVMPDSVGEGQKEIRIPSKYNTKTTLKATVKPGVNENVNFDLEI